MMEKPTQTAEQQVVNHAADRLCTEFDNRFPRHLVLRIVGLCIDDLAGTPRGAIPELCERLARQRLLDMDNRDTSTEFTAVRSRASSRAEIREAFGAVPMSPCAVANVPAAARLSSGGVGR